MGNLGKVLAGGGCLLWLVTFVLGIVISVASGVIANIVPDLAPYISMLSSGSCCCSSLGFISFVVGVILILVGGNSAPAEAE